MKRIIMLCLFTLMFLQVTKSQNLVTGEYFFDTDPGVGNGTPLPSFLPTDTVIQNFSININALSSGFHKLYIRYKDINNKWGLYQGHQFYILLPPPTLPIAGNLITGEYFFDTDPGIGNGTPLPTFSPSDTVVSTISIPANSLNTGSHNLFVRYKDSNNKWGAYQTDTFYVLSCAQAFPSFSVNNNSLCLGDSLLVTNSSTGTTPSSVYSWDIDNDGITDYTTTGNVTHLYNTAGSYDVQLSIANGACEDSVVQTVLVNSSTVGTDVQNVCTTFTWIDGNTYTNSNNTATFTYLGGNVNGCDSVVILNLTLTNIDTIVSLAGAFLISNQSVGTYQWIDCGNGNSPINGATNQSFTPTSSGTYAVILSYNGCVDTSVCYAVTGLQTIPSFIDTRIYPNPFSDNLQIDINENEPVKLQIYTTSGILIYQKELDGRSKNKLAINHAAGVYIMELTNQKGNKRIVKIVKL